MLDLIASHQSIIKSFHVSLKEMAVTRYCPSGLGLF
jgi:hypothetical protein